MVATILLPILSGSVVLVQRRSDDDTSVNYDYDNSVTNDNIDLAGGYYNSQESEDTNNQYYDPYYGYGSTTGYNGYYNTYNYDNTNAEGGRGLTFGDASFYFGNWVDTAGSMFNRAAKSLKE